MRNIVNRLKNLLKQSKVQAIIMSILLVVVAFNAQLSFSYDKDELVRFHVIADDNSNIQQADKLAVKDGILAFVKDDLLLCNNVEESREYLKENLGEIKKVSEDILKERGNNNEVQVYFGNFDFPVKYYGAFSLPSGNYEALRVVIGKGDGENWWCVLYPQMCLSAASDNAYTDLEPQKEVVVKWRVKQWWDKLTEDDE